MTLTATQQAARVGMRPARLDRAYLDAPGFYAISKAKGAAEVGAVVVYAPTPDPWFPDNDMDRSFWWSVYADEVLYRGPAKEPDWLLIGRRIDEDEYRFLIADRAHARAYRPASIEAATTKPIRSAQIDPATLF